MYAWLSTVLLVIPLLTIPSLMVRAGAIRHVFFDATTGQRLDRNFTLGVGTHEGIGGDRGYVPNLDRALMSELGVTSFRDDLPWQTFENKGNDARIEEEKHRLFELLGSGVSRPLIILGHGNLAVPNGAPPLTDAARSAFANSAVKAIEATASFRAIYEIWNEWNIGEGTDAQLPRLRDAGTIEDPRSATNYVKMAAAARRAIRANSSGSSVIYGAVGDDPNWLWTLAAIKAGLLEDDEGLSVHLYNHCQRIGRRTATEAIDRLTKLHLAVDQSIPLYVTEIGWPTSGKCSVTPQEAADNIAQFVLWGRSAGWIRGIWIYELKDSGKLAQEIEHNFGLYDYMRRPKPAACALREVSDLLSEASTMQVSREFSDIFLLQITTPTKRMIVGWTTSDLVQATIRFEQGVVSSVKSICRAQAPITGELTLEKTPVIVTVQNNTTLDVLLELQ